MAPLYGIKSLLPKRDCGVELELIENTLLPLILNALFLARPLIKQQTATITAIKKINPSMQNANARLDVDRHKVPSDFILLAFTERSSSIK